MSPELQAVADQVERRPILINYEKLRWVTGMLRVLELRGIRQLINILARHDELNQSQLISLLKDEQSTTSLRLTLLRRYKIVTTRRDGRWIYYQINRVRVAKINYSIDKFLNS